MTPVNYPIKIKKIPDRKPGRIKLIVDDPNLSHERATAEILAHFGYDVIFIKPIDRINVRTADCYFNGEIWEIKCPIRNTETATIRDLKAALLQSKNVIINTTYSKRSVRQTAIDVIRYIRKRRTRRIQKVFVLDGENYCMFGRNDVL